MDGKRMKWKKRTPSVTKGVFTIERLVGAQVHLTLSSLVLFVGVKAVLLTLGADYMVWVLRLGHLEEVV